MRNSEHNGAKILLSLTQEQFDRLQPLADERIVQALETGREDRDAIEADAKRMNVSPQTRFY